MGSIALAPGSAEFGAVGSTVQFSATAARSDGAPLPEADIAWTTAPNGVIAVDSTGLVTSIGNGAAQLIATSGSVSAEVTVTVSQVPISLAHEGSILLNVIGERAALDPFAVDSNGVRVTPPSMFSYTSSDLGVATVDLDGIVTANQFGSATITVSRSGLATAVDVEVVSTGFYSPVLGGEVPCSGSMAGQFPCEGIDLVAFLPLAGLGIAPLSGVLVNSLWGWEDPVTNRRYALLGRSDGVVFIEVTDSLDPRTVGFLPGSLASSNFRSMRIWDDHLFVVAPIGGHGVQIFDLRRLRGAAEFTEFTENGRYIDVGGASNIAINEASGFGYVAGVNGGIECGGGLHMLDLGTATSPAFAGCYVSPAGGLNHSECVDYSGPDTDHVGREICFASNSFSLSVLDVTDKSNVVELAIVGGGGGVQGTLTEDQGTFVMSNWTDESSEPPLVPTRMRVWDVSDLDSPVLARVYEGPTFARDYDVRTLGPRIYQSNGTYGFRLLDAVDPANPIDLARFDTHPPSVDSEQQGARSNFLFDDGLILVSSQQEGFFILRPTS